MENKVKPAVQAFLAQRGLSLSVEKTHTTHINTGFDFLGFNIRKYKQKSAKWLNRRYFTTVKMNHWRFFAWDKDSQGNITKRILYRADSTPIKRHVKILGAANPFLKEYVEYFEKRKANARLKPRGTLLHLLPVQFDHWT